MKQNILKRWLVVLLVVLSGIKPLPCSFTAV